MPQRAAMIGSLPEALGMERAMRATARIGAPTAGRRCAGPPAGIIRYGMTEDIDHWFGSRGRCDGCNGTHLRRLPCEPGNITSRRCLGAAVTAPPPRRAPLRRPVAGLFPEGRRAAIWMCRNIYMG